MAAIVSDWITPLSEPRKTTPREYLFENFYIVFSEKVWLNGESFVLSDAEILPAIFNPNYLRSDTTINISETDYVLSVASVVEVTIGGYVESSALIVVASSSYIKSDANIVQRGFGTFSGFTGT